MQVVPFLAYQEPKSRISWVFENGKHTLSIFGFTCTYKQEGQLNIFGILKFLSGQTHYLKKMSINNRFFFNDWSNAGCYHNYWAIIGRLEICNYTPILWIE